MVDRIDERKFGKNGQKCESIYGIQTQITNYSIEWTHLCVKWTVCFFLSIFYIQFDFLLHWLFSGVTYLSLFFGGELCRLLFPLKNDLLVILFGDVRRFVEIDCLARLRPFFTLSTPIIHALANQPGYCVSLASLSIRLFSVQFQRHSNLNSRSTRLKARISCSKRMDFDHILWDDKLPMIWITNISFQKLRHRKLFLFVGFFLYYYFGLPFYSMVRPLSL